MPIGYEMHPFLKSPKYKALCSPRGWYRCRLARAFCCWPALGGSNHLVPGTKPSAPMYLVPAPGKTEPVPHGNLRSDGQLSEAPKLATLCSPKWAHCWVLKNATPAKKQITGVLSGYFAQGIREAIRRKRRLHGFRVNLSWVACIFCGKIKTTRSTNPKHCLSFWLHVSLLWAPFPAVSD